MLSQSKMKNKKNTLNLKVLKENFYVINTPEEINEIIDSAIQESLVAVVDITDEGRLLKITPEGKLSLAIYWSQNFSPSFKSFNARFVSMMHANNQLPLPQLQIMQLYHGGKTDISVLQERFTTLSKTQEMKLAFHRHMICDIAGKSSLSADDFIFHFTPTLFAPVDLTKRKVSLEISGLADVPTLTVSSPYNNKRYYIAGLRKGRMNTAHGFYPIISNKDSFPLSQEITLHWKIDNEIKIDHVLKIDFNFQNPHGQLFSTVQQFSRKISGVPSFSIVTTLEKNKIHDFNARIIPHDIFNHFEIQQHVVLTNFPMELHQYHTSKYFQEWYTTSIENNQE